MRRRDFIVQTMAAATAMTSNLRAALKQDKLDEAAALVQRFVGQKKLRAAALHVRRDDAVFQRAFGEAPSPDTIFLLASITKPMTAAGLMILADRGELSLSDPVHKFIPEFAEGDRKRITIKHLLTHTSGLPDQLPENVELRKRHAPLKEFAARAIRTPLLFTPGEKVEYQSMGILLAAEVAERVTLQPFREFLRKELFEPLGMTRTALGLGNFTIAETAQCQVEAAPGLYGGGDENKSWDWNSRYWRDFGAPWGGAHSTAPDVSRFLEYFLNPHDGVLKKETAASMIVNQNQGLDVPWGIGFKVNADDFGRGCSPRAFGHAGATGTLAWADPETRLIFVLLTTLPLDESRDVLIRPVSDLVSESAA